jgi:hypothetical protein
VLYLSEVMTIIDGGWGRRGGVIMSDLILFAHPTLGVLGILCAVWVFVETLNASDRNIWRIRLASIAVTLFICGAGVLGGYWYIHYYAPEKDVILKGPWPWAHNIVMETKENLFFIPLVLAFYLPIVASGRLTRSRATRYLLLTVAFLIIGSGLAIEGGGALIDYGVKVAFLHSGGTGVQ